MKSGAITKQTEFIQVPAGHLDEIAISDEEIRVAGWMLCPEEPLVRLEILMDGAPLGEATSQERPDVARVHRWISHARQAGFFFRCHGPSSDAPVPREIEVRGVGRSGRQVSLRSLLSHDSRCRRPAPPKSLFKLVGSPDASSFASQGLKVFSDVTSAIRLCDDMGRFRRVLDWGCGCGRLLAHLFPAFPDKQFTGCDPVPDAIEWCRTQFPAGQFECIGPFPPTRFDQAEFDLVIGSSVFTHLDRHLQLRWLEELARILKPGGLLVASVLGRYAYLRDLCSGSKGRNPLKFYFAKRRLGPGVIIDEFRNDSLRDHVRSDYYRNTYQGRHYTLREWSRFFRIRAYLERGLDNYQDLLVMQRPSSDSPDGQREGARTPEESAGQSYGQVS